MRIVILVVAGLLPMTAVAEFKMTVVAPPKPAVKVVEQKREPTPPVTQVTVAGTPVEQGSVDYEKRYKELLAKQIIENKKSKSKPAQHVDTPVLDDVVSNDMPKAVELTERTPSDAERKATVNKQLLEKSEQVKNIEPKYVSPAVSVKRIDKPYVPATIYRIKAGETVEEIIERWALVEKYTVEWSLGKKWGRIKNLKIRAGASYGIDFTSSVGIFIDSLNKLAQFTDNDITLNASVYTNRYIMLTVTEGE